jgi:hypothetical protein
VDSLWNSEKTIRQMRQNALDQWKIQCEEKIQKCHKWKSKRRQQYQEMLEEIEQPNFPLFEFSFVEKPIYHSSNNLEGMGRNTSIVKGAMAYSTKELLGLIQVRFVKAERPDIPLPNQK